MRLRDFAMTVSEVTGNASLVRVGARDAQDQYLACQVADPTRARHILGWRPADDLEARIRRTAEWWLERWRLVPSGPRRASVARPSVGGRWNKGSSS